MSHPGEMLHSYARQQLPYDGEIALVTADPARFLFSKNQLALQLTLFSDWERVR